MIVLAVVGVFVVIYFIKNDDFKKDHPTLNEKAKLPDQFLKNVAHYAQEDRLQQGAYSLEKAIESIWKLEGDVDEESFAMLEQAVSRLEQVHRAMLNDTLDRENMKEAFEFALNNLARAELEISEMYAETDQMEEANIALKYAQLHVKNAMLFHDPFFNRDSVQLAIEARVFEEMDSLLSNNSISPIDYALAVDRMIKEVDEVIK